MNFSVRSNMTGEIKMIVNVISLDQAHQMARKVFNGEKMGRICSERFYVFEEAFEIGQKFLTNVDLIYKDLYIPKGTMAEIIELLSDGEYKVYFNCKGAEDHIECIQIYSIEEFNKMISSSEMIEMVDDKKATKVIDNRKPLGRFWLMSGKKYVAIDNSTGDAWTEEFETEKECFEYLMRVGKYND